MRNYLIFLVWMILPLADAETISFVGNLRTDANVTTLGPSNSDADYAQWAAVVDSFTVGTPSEMQAITFSYGGGVNGAGTVIPEGGFEPYLSLFDSSGNFLASTFLGTTCPSGANTNTVSGECFDELLDGGILAPGTYQIAISAFENFSLAENFGTGTLADGFIGLGNLNPGEDLHYAYDVILTSTAVPEPSVGWLLGALVFGLAAMRRKQIRKETTL